MKICVKIPKEYAITDVQPRVEYTQQIEVTEEEKAKESSTLNKALAILENIERIGYAVTTKNNLVTIEKKDDRLIVNIDDSLQTDIEEGK